MGKNLIEILISAKDKSSAEIGKSGSALGKVWNVLKSGPAIAVAAVTGVVAAFGKMTSETAKVGDQLAKTSKRIGVSTESLSTLAFAAERSGANLESLTTGFRTLARNANEAEKGTKTQKDAFDALGISVTGADGKLKDLDDLLLESADAFAGMENDTQAAALAQDIFGRSGLALLPMLKEGSAGISELQKRARDLGIEFSGKSAADAEAFVDAQTDLHEAMRGVRDTIGKALLPVLTKLINWFVDGFVYVRRWAKENEDNFRKVQKVAGDVVSKVAWALGKYYETIEEVLAKVGGALDWIGEKTGLWESNVGGFFENAADTVRETTESIVASIDSWGEQTAETKDEVGEDLEKLSYSFEETGEAAEDAGEKIASAGSAASDASDDFEEMGPPIELAGDLLEETGGKTDDAADAIRRYGDEAQTATGKLGGFLDGLSDLGRGLGIDIPLLDTASAAFSSFKSITSGLDKIGLGGLTKAGGGLAGQAGSAALGGLRSAGSSLLGNAGAIGNAGGGLAIAAGEVAILAKVGNALAGQNWGAGSEGYLEREQRLAAASIASERRAQAGLRGTAAGSGGGIGQMSDAEIAAYYGTAPAKVVHVTVQNNGPLMGNAADAARFGRLIRDEISEINEGTIG